MLRSTEIDVFIRYGATRFGSRTRRDDAGMTVPPLSNALG